MAANRKPVHLTQVNNGREFLWQCMRMLKVFTIADITNSSAMRPDSAHEYVRALVRAGYVAVKERPAARFVLTQYILIKDAPTAPRVRKNGAEVTAGRGQENMWRSMRLLKDFSAVDIAATASAGGVKVSLSAARSYCARLCKAGYLHGKQGRFKFIPSMYTGPGAPMIQRNKQVYDPNLKKVVWPKEDNR